MLKPSICFSGFFCGVWRGFLSVNGTDGRDIFGDLRWVVRASLRVMGGCGFNGVMGLQIGFARGFSIFVVRVDLTGFILLMNGLWLFKGFCSRELIAERDEIKLALSVLINNSEVNALCFFLLYL